MTFAFFRPAPANNSMNKMNSNALLAKLRQHGRRNQYGNATRTMKVLNTRYLQGKLSANQASELLRIATQLSKKT